MKLLLATDFSGDAPAVDMVNARPWPSGTEVCVLHVVDPDPFPPGAELLETARRGAESVVKSIAAGLEPSGLKTQREVLVGYPRTAIVDFAGKWGADFILIGSHRTHNLARLLLGSVAQAVVRAAPCSVEIVRRRAKNLSDAGSGWKILLATDGSDCAKTAVRSAAERPWPTGTCVRVVSVVPLFMPIADAGTAYFDAAQAAETVRVVEDELGLQAVEAIGQAEKTLRQAGSMQVEKTEPISGDPKHVIVEEASKYGATMIVMGSHGRRGVDRLMMGSVSEFVASHAHCSVEVIR